ncbi:MAG: phosphatidylserine decarboxylase [Deltaproteobacteria bacterium]|nr:phosphatidylserine decarboxylase [Deltaproteobacteria bacterium]
MVVELSGSVDMFKYVQELFEQAAMTALNAVPKTAFSKALGWGAEVRGITPIHRAAINVFARIYSINEHEVERKLNTYDTLNEFFTRRLRAGARITAEGDDIVTSPADGILTQIGTAEQTNLLQAKGLTYDLAALLGSDQDAQWFQDGSYVTIYLRPHDYHRVHSPVTGVVQQVRWIPGDRFPVVPMAVHRRENLYSRNERLVVILDTRMGRVAVIMVASIGVGNMSLTWDDHFRTGDRNHHVDSGRLQHLEGYRLTKGDELGVFHLGSTVIVLFEQARVAFQRMAPGARLFVGLPLAEVR